MANEKVILYRSSGGGGSILAGYPPESAANFAASSKSGVIQLTWTDPEDLPITDGETIIWGFTRIVRKTGSFPTNESDGTVVVENSVRNQYQSTPFIDNTVSAGTTYYYAAFTCSNEGVYNRELVTVSCMANSYKIMTVIIDESNSNPSKCCTYADDAIGMGNGKDDKDWAEFFGYRTCLFKSGAVVGYLNPNDFSKFENGDPADITSGNSGDVMIEFPRRGIRIVPDGRKKTISMTDDPDNPDFTYYAHTRGTARKDYFYLGAFSGCVQSGYLRSLKGLVATDNRQINQYRVFAHSQGSGYEIFTYFQLVFIQCMFVLQFKTLDSQSVIGIGRPSFDLLTTGLTSDKGMNWGNVESSGDPVKLFGIEDIWGGVETLIDGIISIDDEPYRFKYTTDGFNNDMTDYEDAGIEWSWNSSMSGYMKYTLNTSLIPFIGTNFNGSQTTYYCDMASLPNGKKIPAIGCMIDGDYYTGLWYMMWKTVTSASTVGARLSYY